MLRRSVATGSNITGTCTRRGGEEKLKAAADVSPLDKEGGVGAPLDGHGIEIWPGAGQASGGSSAQGMSGAEGGAYR